METTSKDGGGARKLRGHMFQQNHKAEKRKWKWPEPFISKSIPRDILPPARLYYQPPPPPYRASNWRLSGQMPKTMEVFFFLIQITIMLHKKINFKRNEFVYKFRKLYTIQTEMTIQYSKHVRS